jgi:hypothetical protein
MIHAIPKPFILPNWIKIRMLGLGQSVFGWMRTFSLPRMMMEHGTEIVL